jgi:hypothetical protein
MEMIAIEKMFKAKNITTMTTANKWITIAATDRTLICPEAEANLVQIQK